MARKIKKRNLGISKNYSRSGFGRFKVDLSAPAKHTATMPRPELFLIPADTITASVFAEVRATYADMTSLGIAHLPYSHCIIGVPGRTAFTLSTPSGFVIPANEAQLGRIKFPKGTPLKEIDDTLECLDTYAKFEARFHFYSEKLINVTLRKDSISPWHSLEDVSDEIPNGRSIRQVKADLDDTAAYVRELLIVLLATRNAIKTRVKDKLLALGIGRNKRRLNNQRPLYTTTITLPTLGDTPTGQPTGRTVAPHLRRGHIRNQAWGPRRSFHKSVWIDPIFVNADPSYVSTRVAYNTSL